MWTGRSSSSWSRMFVVAAAAAAFPQGVLPKCYSYLDTPECFLFTVRLHGKGEGWRRHLLRQWLVDFYDVLWFMRESNLAQLLPMLEIWVYSLIDIPATFYCLLSFTLVRFSECNWAQINLSLSNLHLQAQFTQSAQLWCFFIFQGFHAILIQLNFACPIPIFPTLGKVFVFRSSKEQKTVNT